MLISSGAIFGFCWVMLRFAHTLHSIEDALVLVFVATFLGVPLGAIGPAVLVLIRFLRKRDLATGLKRQQSESSGLGNL
jgi:integral membrane sensor domain MASE1